jgi:hypothetical protein
VKKRAGHRICDPPENSNAGAITTGPDDALWLTGPASGKIVRITEFALPNPNAQPGGITTGPGGALWFTEASCVREQSSRCIVGNKIGRITTAGAVTVTKANARCQPLRSAAFERLPGPGVIATTSAAAKKRRKV